MAENKQRFPGFIGPAYLARSERFDAQRLVNMYIELDDLGSGKGQEPAVLIATPGLERQQIIGNGPIRCTYTQSNQELTYIVSGNSVYTITGPNATPTLITGTLNTSSGAVQAVDNGSSVIFVDGYYGYHVTIGVNTLNLISDANFHPTETISYQDGYFIGVQKGTNAFFLSDINSIDFPPLNEAYAAGSPDILVSAVSNNRELYLFGTKSLEIWYNQGTSASTPFVRQDGKYSQVGCAASQSVVVLNNTLVWLGSNSQGGGVVYTLDGGMPTRISNHSIEFAIQTAGDLSGSTAYGYQQEGHYFYLLTIPSTGTTWCYDVTNKQWHERQSTINGVTGRHLGNTHCVLNGQHVVGDYRNGNVYVYNLDHYQDNGQDIQRIRQTPHVSQNLNRLFYKLLEVDMQFGVGLPNQGAPRITLYISNDGGQTWGNPIFANLGATGRYNVRARWQRLGSSRDRVFRVVVTAPVKVQMLSAMLDIEVGSA